MRLCLLSIAFLATSVAFAQRSTIVAGPMLGHTEMRTAKLWVQLAPGITDGWIHVISQSGGSRFSKRYPFRASGSEFNTVTLDLTGLEPGTQYSYRLFDGIFHGVYREYIAAGVFTTQSLWQYRSEPPNFSFLTGSCAYFNQPEYDRPGKPYGGDSSIFLSMAKEKADFHLWLGDNWYTREVDYFSEWGLSYRASHDRALPVLQPLLKAMPQYAIWDDHDFGPNNSDHDYIFKNASREVFKKFWANPSYGDNDKNAIYTKFIWNDVEFFLLDDRWYRDNDEVKDSVNGLPNPEKMMFGKQQMKWLKNNLLSSAYNSKISFRIIVSGSQMLNLASPLDCFTHYPAEYGELLKFLNNNNISGVVFVTGDRHHSEIIKQDRAGQYPLYDITVSPYTSGVSKTRDAEINNPQRVGPEIDEQNYAKFSFSGGMKDRKLTIAFFGIEGNKLYEWTIGISDLK